MKNLLRRALQPLVRISLRMGVSVQDFTDLVTESYVDVARSEFGVRGRPTNTSRVALLTGMSRAKVVAVEKAAKEVSSEEDVALESMRHISRLLLGWHTDKAFLDDEGKPLELAVNGEAPSFQALYDEYSGRVAPMTSMLKELIHVGAVGKQEDGRLVALAAHYIPQKTSRVALERGCQVIGDLADTISRNLYPMKRDLTRFERITTNQLIPKSREAEFKQILALEGKHFLARVDDWLASVEMKEPDASLIRMGVGVFEINSKPIAAETTRKDGA